jgi:hypothetical protein
MLSSMQLVHFLAYDLLLGSRSKLWHRSEITGLSTPFTAVTGYQKDLANLEQLAEGIPMVNTKVQTMPIG